MVLRPLQVDIRLVEQLMPLTLPKIAAHLDAYGVPLQLGAASWIMTLFADCFPASTSLRFWDWMVIKVHSCGLCASWHLGFHDWEWFVLFAQGRDAVAFLVLGVFALFEAEILQARDTLSLMNLLKSMSRMLTTALAGVVV